MPRRGAATATTTKSRSSLRGLRAGQHCHCGKQNKSNVRPNRLSDFPLPQSYLPVRGICWGPLAGLIVNPTRLSNRKKRAPARARGSTSLERIGDSPSEAGSVGTVARATVARAAVARAAVTEPIVETNFQHLNVAVRPESVSQEGPRPKR